MSKYHKAYVCVEISAPIAGYALNGQKYPVDKKPLTMFAEAYSDSDEDAEALANQWLAFLGYASRCFWNMWFVVSIRYKTGRTSVYDSSIEDDSNISPLAKKDYDAIKQLNDEEEME